MIGAAGIAAAPSTARGKFDRGRTALSEVTPQLIELIRSIRRPDAPAVGDWNVSDVATHLTHVAAGALMVSKTAGTAGVDEPDGSDIVALAASFNRAGLGGDSERDPSVLADRLEGSVNELLEEVWDMSGDETVPWLGGVTITIAGVVCHLLEEFLVHGYDIAGAENSPWRAAPAHAGLAFGFVLDLIRGCGRETRRTFVHQEAARGLHVTYDFRIRGIRRDFIVFDDGLVTLEDPSDRPVDCRISADPVAALLVGMGRRSAMHEAARGRMFAWGRRPWLSLRLPMLLRNP